MGIKKTVKVREAKNNVIASLPCPCTGKKKNTDPATVICEFSYFGLRGMVRREGGVMSRGGPWQRKKKKKSGNGVWRSVTEKTPGLIFSLLSRKKQTQ